MKKVPDTIAKFISLRTRDLESESDCGPKVQTGEVYWSLARFLKVHGPETSAPACGRECATHAPARPDGFVLLEVLERLEV